MESKRWVMRAGIHPRLHSCTRFSLKVWNSAPLSRRTFGRGKVYDVTVLLEHVYLFNGLDRLHIQLLQRGLELLVVRAGCLVDFLLFPSRRTLAPVINSKLAPIQAI